MVSEEDGEDLIARTGIRERQHVERAVWRLEVSRKEKKRKGGIVNTYNTTQIPHGSDSSTEDTIRMRVYMRHQCKIGTVARLEEERHAGNQAKHHALVMRVQEPNSDEEGAGNDADKADPGVFEPEVLGDFDVEDICNNTT